MKQQEITSRSQLDKILSASTSLLKNLLEMGPECIEEFELVGVDQERINTLKVHLRGLIKTTKEAMKGL